MSAITESELLALQLSDLHRDAPFAIGHISSGIFSIARLYGGMTYQGRRFEYIAEHDECVRADVLKWLKKHRKQQAALDKLEAENEALGLERCASTCDMFTTQPTGQSNAK